MEPFDATRSTMRNRTVSANLCVVFKCTALARTNDREKKKRLLNDTRYKHTPTRMVVWNRVTLDNQHRTMKNKCCTISHKARNRRPRKQMWFTSRHIKCWYFPPRNDRCKTAVLHTLDVQPLNKTHHTHSTLLPNHRRDGFVKSHVGSDNKFPNSCCGQNQQP